MKCFRCNNKLEIEHEKMTVDYPLQCKYCDENMFIFEGESEYENESNDLYRYVEMIKNIIESGSNDYHVLLWI